MADGNSEYPTEIILPQADPLTQDDDNRSLIADFELAMAYVNAQGADIFSKEQQVSFYGLQKQIQFGDITLPKPLITDRVRRAKWFAWDAQQGKEKYACMVEYLGFLNEAIVGWRVLFFATSVLSLTMLDTPVGSNVNEG